MKHKMIPWPKQQISCSKIYEKNDDDDSGDDDDSDGEEKDGDEGTYKKTTRMVEDFLLRWFEHVIITLWK